MAPVHPRGACWRSDGGASGWLLPRAIPQLLAFVYYHVSWLLYVIAPRLRPTRSTPTSRTTPSTATCSSWPSTRSSTRQPWTSAFADDYGAYATVADVLRRIALDEREHRDESLARIACARYRPGDETHPAAQLEPRESH